MCPSHYQSHTCQHFSGSSSLNNKPCAWSSRSCTQVHFYLPYIHPWAKPWASVTQRCLFWTHCGTFRPHIPGPWAWKACMPLPRVCQLFHSKAMIPKLIGFKESSRKHISEVQTSLLGFGGPGRPLCFNAEKTGCKGGATITDLHWTAPPLSPSSVPSEKKSCIRQGLYIWDFSGSNTGKCWKGNSEIISFGPLREPDPKSPYHLLCGDIST